MKSVTMLFSLVVFICVLLFGGIAWWTHSFDQEFAKNDAAWVKEYGVVIKNHDPRTCELSIASSVDGYLSARVQAKNLANGLSQIATKGHIQLIQYSGSVGFHNKAMLTNYLVTLDSDVSCV